MTFDPSTATLVESGFDAKTATLVPEPKRNPFFEVLNQGKAGALVDLPRMTGKAIQYASNPGSGVYDFGESIANAADVRGQREDLKPDENAGPVTKFFAEGARMIPQSVVPPLVAGAALAATPVSAGVGLALAGAAGAVPAGMSQGQETLEKARKAGVSEKDALEAARINALIEGGGEAVGSYFGGKMLGVLSKPLTKMNPGVNPYAEVLRQLNDRSVVRPILKQFPATAAAEVATEMGQNYGQAAVENSYGIDKKDPWESAKEAISPTLAMTTLLAPFGVIGHARTAKQREKIINDLADPNADLSDRVSAVQQVYSTLAQHDKELAERFRAKAGVSLHEGKPVTLSEDSKDNELTALPDPSTVPPSGGGGITPRTDIERQQREQEFSDRNEALWAARNIEEARRKSLEKGPLLLPGPSVLPPVSQSTSPLSDASRLLPSPNSNAVGQFIVDKDGNTRPATMEEAYSQSRKEYSDYRVSQGTGPLKTSLFKIKADQLPSGSQEAATKRAEALRARTGIEHEVVRHPTRRGAFVAVPKAIDVQSNGNGNDNNLSTRSESGVEKPPLSGVAFQGPDEIKQSEHEQYLTKAGVEKGIAQRIASKERAPRDIVTGFYNANEDDGNGGVQEQTIKRAQEHVKKTGDSAFYVSADIANLGGLNAAMGNVKSKANAHYKAIANMMSSELESIGARVIPMRTGGDELGAVVVGGNRDAIKKAIASATKKIEKYNNENNLHKIPHPKRQGEFGVGLHIGFSDILTDSNVQGIVDQADAEVDRSKNNVGRIKSETQSGISGVTPGSGAGGTRGQDQATGRDEANAGTVPRQGKPQGSAELLDADAGQGYIQTPLAGLPTTVNVDGKDVTFGPFEPARKSAESYAKSVGIDYKPPTDYVKVDASRAKRIAQAFEDLKHDPDNPQVRAAYQALSKETIAQYEAMLKTGITVEFFPDGIDTYGNPRNAILDVVKNNHLYIFQTEHGFGSDQSFDPNGNPLLEFSEHEISGQKARVNDLFRAIHDYYGHVKEGVGFRADGEENAWRQHMAMFTPLAQKALTTETRGQNSWVNFGPHGLENRDANPLSTVYANQKIGLMPDWVVNGEKEIVLESRVKEIPAPIISKPTPSFVKKLKVKASAYDVETDQYKELEMSARDALTAVRQDINNMKALLHCVRG